MTKLEMLAKLEGREVANNTTLKKDFPGLYKEECTIGEKRKTASNIDKKLRDFYNQDSIRIDLRDELIEENGWKVSQASRYLRSDEGLELYYKRAMKELIEKTN